MARCQEVTNTASSQHVSGSQKQTMQTDLANLIVLLGYSCLEAKAIPNTEQALLPNMCNDMHRRDTLLKRQLAPQGEPKRQGKVTKETGQGD